MLSQIQSQLKEIKEKNIKIESLNKKLGALNYSGYY